jgi:hypothetical protein
MSFIFQDYMERIGMDLKIQCVLCAWAGPRFILEHHIRTVRLDLKHFLPEHQCTSFRY